MKSRALICDADVVWTEGLKRALEAEDIGSQEVDSMEEYQRLSQSARYSVCILGLDTLRERVAELQGNGDDGVWAALKGFCRISPLPVVLAVEERRDEEEICAFRSGVADYVSKSGNMEVCAAHIQAAIRSRSIWAGQRGDFMLDETSHQLVAGGGRIRLTNREYGVLAFLYANYNQAVNREALLVNVWNVCEEKNKRVVDTVVKQLRRKLIATPYEIRSVYKLGYQLQMRDL